MKYARFTALTFTKFLDWYQKTGQTTNNTMPQILVACHNLSRIKILCAVRTSKVLLCLLFKLPIFTLKFLSSNKIILYIYVTDMKYFLNIERYLLGRHFI